MAISELHLLDTETQLEPDSIRESQDAPLSFESALKARLELVGYLQNIDQNDISVPAWQLIKQIPASDYIEGILLPAGLSGNPLFKDKILRLNGYWETIHPDEKNELFNAVIFYNKSKAPDTQKDIRQEDIDPVINTILSRGFSVRYTLKQLKMVKSLDFEREENILAAERTIAAINDQLRRSIVGKRIVTPKRRNKYANSLQTFIELEDADIPIFYTRNRKYKPSRQTQQYAAESILLLEPNLSKLSPTIISAGLSSDNDKVKSLASNARDKILERSNKGKREEVLVFKLPVLSESSD